MSRDLERVDFSKEENNILKNLKRCLADGENIQAGNNYALVTASDYGMLRVVKFLVNNGADIHVENNAPLAFAVVNEHTALAKYLIKKGADLNSAFLWACHVGATHAVKSFIELGADVHTENNKGFEYAVKHGHFLIVESLMEAGVNATMDMVKDIKITTDTELFKKEDYPNLYGLIFKNLPENEGIKSIMSKEEPEENKNTIKGTL